MNIFNFHTENSSLLQNLLTSFAEKYEHPQRRPFSLHCRTWNEPGYFNFHLNWLCEGILPSVAGTEERTPGW